MREQVQLHITLTPAPPCVCRYRRHAGSKFRLLNEQFIELFDADLVSIPPTAPLWLRWCQQPSAAALERTNQAPVPVVPL